jgi:geranylgeranyl diphosphate synthase type II
LASAFESRAAASSLFPTEPATLYEPLRYFLRLGGKRVRPVLCLMGAELFDTVTDDAWHAANAIELFHNFTLIHDDIMDKAPLRRGRSTVHEKWNLPTAILSGDALCIYAYGELARMKAPLQPLLSLFNRTAIEVCEGQQLDMDFEKRDDVMEEEYIRMIALKTSVLLACSLKMGALLGGATEGAGDKLYEFGKALGVAFQLQDDYLDAFGAPEKLGKQAGGDILADKKTFLHIAARNSANESQRAELNRCASLPADEKVGATLRVFAATGADKSCRDAVALYSSRAFDCLDALPVLSKRKEPLKALATYLLHRDF